MSPARPAATTATPTVTGGATTRWPDWHVRSGPQQQSARGDVRRFQHVAFLAVGTGHSPGGSASTHHDPFALLRDERRRHRLYGQINTINALGPAAARTRPTLLVQLGRTTIEALVDTGASATVINAKTFAQVPDKDKVRLDTHANQLGLTGAMKHPLEILGVYKVQMTIPVLGAVSPVVIVVRNISWPLILGMDLLQIYGVNIDAQSMHVTWTPAGADERAEIVLARQTFLPAYSSKVVKASVKSFLRKPTNHFYSLRTATMLQKRCTRANTTEK